MAANSDAARAFGGELQTGIMLPGKVRFWNEVKGFGFITPEGGGPDVYANCEVLTDGDKLSRDLEVTFEAAWDERTGKYRATEVVGALVSQKEEEIEAEEIAREQAAMNAAVPTDELVPTPRLVISGLAEDATQASIDELLILYGAVLHCELLPGGRAIVSMESVEEARRVAESFHEEGIEVRLATAADVIERKEVETAHVEEQQVHDAADDADTEIQQSV